jgi:two-component system response regulator (stage 0 sporulation protein A)
MNGLELIRRIRDLEGSRQPAVIVTSALGFPEIVRQAVAAGVVDFIIKPYDVDVLVERVREVKIP